MNKKEKILILFVISLSFIFVTGFTNISKTPKTLYRVYLKGKSLGLIESKKELEDYIDEKQEEIKTKYKVDKVYMPTDLEIEKETTYENNIKTIETIYEEIKDISPFTISGYKIKIKGVERKDESGTTTKAKTQYIYVIKKSVFTNSMENAVKSFIDEESYEKYKEDKQAEIVDTGSIIENIYVKNKITITKENIPVNENIYMSEDELSKYLLFGTTKEQATYTVQGGDTIADVSFNNKISTEEFLIANPSLSDENSLLTEGQVVTIGMLNPQFSVVEEDHVVKDEESNYQTETVEDSSKCSTESEVTQAGVKGLNRVTQKVQKINGEITNTVTITNEVLKTSTKEIITKGTKNCGSSYYYGDYSGARPVATTGYFGWPASCSSISSGYGYRWGVLHDGQDINGCGYGSPIYAAADGVVEESKSKAVNGEYIIIRHPNGYYTIYAHMCPGCRYVSKGDTVYKGQVIGGMGMTGNATGVHLHFGIWYGYPYYGGRSMNPMSFY